MATATPLRGRRDCERPCPGLSKYFQQRNEREDGRMNGGTRVSCQRDAVSVSRRDPRGHPACPWGDDKGTRGMSGRETRLPPTRSFVTPYCRCCRCCCCGRLLGVAGDRTMRASRDRQYVRFVRVDIPRLSQWWRTPPEWSTCVCTARVSQGTLRHAESTRCS